MNNGEVTTRDHLEGIFREFKERYISDQTSRDKKFEDFKSQLKDESRVLAEKYKSDLQAYPNIEDFNKLQEKVTIEFSSAMTKARALPILISVVAIIIAAAGVAFAWLK